MADVWKIAEYVEAHPKNHEQRWRLAKKLYLAWEYRLALEHLLILKNEWQEKLSVVRYLAATYFRLKRFPEAIEELESAIDIWSDNIDLREQLAHTLHVADRKLDASEAWQTVADMQLDHPTAQKLSDKLRDEVLGDESPTRDKSTKKKKAAPVHEPRVHAPGAELICSNCGARNGPEFERCWQCHGSLASAFEAPPTVDTPKVSQRQTRPSNPFPWPLVAGLTIVALITIGVYLTLREFYPPEDAQVLSTNISVHAFLVHTLGITRILLGVVLLFAWPVILYLSVNMVPVEEDLDQEVILTGFVLASLFYVLTWLPMDLIYLMLVIPIVASLVIIALLFRRYPARAAAIFTLQLAMVAVVIVTVAAAQHGLGFVADAPKIVAYANEHAGATPREIVRKSPFRMSVTWEPTGADWLNETGGNTAFTVKPGVFVGTLTIEVNDGTKRLEFLKVERPSTTFEIESIVTDQPYTLSITGPVGVDIAITIESLMNVTVKGLPPENESS